jgi:hypothetical protein
MTLFLFTSGLLRSQTTALEYFNQAAKQYVKEDKLAALKTLDKGLRAHPGDARMLKLAEELLKEQQNQQQQNQQQQQQQGSQEEQQQAQQQGEQEQEQKQGEERSEKQNGERKMQPDRIAPEDAERMLDALERQEQGTQEKVRSKLRQAHRRRIEKDW